MSIVPRLPRCDNPHRTLSGRRYILWDCIRNNEKFTKIVESSSLILLFFILFLIKLNDNRKLFVAQVH